MIYNQHIDRLPILIPVNIICPHIVIRLGLYPIVTWFGKPRGFMMIFSRYVKPISMIRDQYGHPGLRQVQHSFRQWKRIRLDIIRETCGHRSRFYLRLNIISWYNMSYLSITSVILCCRLVAVFADCILKRFGQSFKNAYIKF